MSKINWQEQLGWGEDQLDDLRFTAYAYIRQGKYDIAIPFFEALCVLDANSSYDIQTLGALYLQIGDGPKALKCFDKALQFEGEHGPTLLNVAKAFFMMGKKEDGLRLVNILKNEENVSVSNVAKALALAYG